MKALTISIAALLLGLAWAREGSPLQQAPPAMAAMANPLESDEGAARAGAKLYRRECAPCHGPNREGIRHAPSLNTVVVTGSPAGALFWVLRNGSLEHGMPSFAHLPEVQRWQIITFLRSGRSAASRN